MPQHLFIVEDDPDLRGMLEDYFTLAGYSVSTTGLAAGCSALLERQDVDLILLDLNLPDGDGLKLLRELRVWSSIPVLVITGRRDQQSHLTALELEADDVITKPFVLRELELRVRNCLTRYHRVPEEQYWPLHPWHFYPRQQCLRLPNSTTDDVPEPVLLTAAESVCLRALIRAEGRLVPSKRLIADMESSLGQVEAESVPVIISRLRQKLRVTIAAPDANPIENVPRQGYRLKLALWGSCAK